jgi:DNA-binding NtrC family response regulator
MLPCAAVPESPPTPAIPRKRALAPEISAPQLYEVLHCAEPLRPPARHSLHGVEEVVVVRGESRKADRDGNSLRLAIPDRHLSVTHARLRRDGDRWRVEDAGSTNGTFVNGEACREAVLSDGDALEMGHTELLFRQEVRQPKGVFDVDAATLDPPSPELATLLPSLAAELGRLPAIARSSVSVVIGGETGTGKEVIARAIHKLSLRPGPFVAVNCGAIAPTLVESELFGHRKGAFSGATENRAGHVRAADRGTLLLDEIGDLPPAAQAALLRVLQEKEVLSVGASEPVKVDVRVLAATHHDLEAAVAAQKFRADLFARISGFTIRLPPLRWRREDLGLLVAGLLRKLDEKRASRISFSCEAGRALLRYRWPLNVRELEKCLEAALALAGDDIIDLEHLPPAVQRSLSSPEPEPPARELPGEPSSVPASLSPEDQRRREELIALLREHQGNVAAVARVLGKGRMQIHRWLKRYDLKLEDFR